MCDNCLLRIRISIHNIIGLIAELDTTVLLAHHVCYVQRHVSNSPSANKRPSSSAILDDDLFPTLSRCQEQK